MGLDDKISNKVDEVKGKAKEAGGEVTDNEDLKNEGKADQVSAAVKDGVNDVKDAVGNIKDKLTGN